MVILGVLWSLVAARRRAVLRSGLAPPELPLPPSIAFVLPVKGTHQESAANWTAQVCDHGYPGHVEVIFVVADEDDDACVLLRQLIKSGRLPSANLRIIVSGHTEVTSQKLHQQMSGIRHVADSTELVLLLDDDMHLHPGAVGWLAQALRDDARAIAACGFSFDVPASRDLLSHVGCMLRLLMATTTSARGGNFAWGGCCMLRAEELRDAGPGSLLHHWQDRGYSDDWALTQLGRRLGRPIANPPGCVFLNLTRFRSFAQLYNFHARQMFVLDTYLPAAPPDEGAGAGARWCCGDGHRRDAWLLLHALWLGGAWWAASLVLLAAQLVAIPLTLLAHPAAWPAWATLAAVRGGGGGSGGEGDGGGGDSCALLAAAASLAATAGLAAPACFAGGAAAVRAQAALLARLASDGGARLRREARWSAWRAAVGFLGFVVLGAAWCLDGFYSRSVVWSGIRYHKRRGRLERVEHAATAAAPAAPARRAAGAGLLRPRLDPGSVWPNDEPIVAPLLDGSTNATPTPSPGSRNGHQR